MAISAVGVGARLFGVARTPAARRDGAPDEPAQSPAEPPAATDLVEYRKGLAAIQAAMEAEKALPLQKGSESRILAHPTPPPKGTIVMLHGFSAGTWQFEDLANRFFKAGYNVYIPRMPGHWDMKMGNVYGLYRHGQTLVSDAAKIKVPMQFFTTEIDDAADQGAIKKVFDRSGGAARNGFYHFQKADDVPHPMVHWRENGHKDKIADLTRMSLEFVERGTKATR
jgi:hypothetical protein